MGDKDGGRAVIDVLRRTDLHNAALTQHSNASTPESIGAQSRATGERNIVVGDWQMGAQLLDRMLITVQVGLVDRQFVENMRTILAEERVALPIYAPKAFSYFQTAAGS